MTNQLMITVRNGTTQHNNTHLLCSPPLWTDYLSFFLGNFAAHAATVVTYPGESIKSTVIAIFLALVFPASGVVRGMTAIVRHAAFISDPLQQAARAGALCMVVRTSDWQPLNGQRITDIVWRGRMERKVGKQLELLDFVTYFLRPTFYLNSLFSGDSPWKDVVKFTNERVSDAGRLDFRFYWPPWMFELSRYWQFLDTLSGLVHKDKKVHGFHSLRPGYAFAHVPRDACVVPNIAEPCMQSCTISTSYSAAKALIAVIQLLFACLTLVRSAHSEIADNGYGSYNLTVVPYAIMSLVNLVGNLVNPGYPALYLVHSEIMTEAMERGSQFDGVVGRLVPETTRMHSVEDNKISGKFYISQDLESDMDTPDDQEQRVTSNGVIHKFDAINRGSASTGPSVDKAIGNSNNTTYLFRPDVMSSTEFIIQIGTVLRTSCRAMSTQEIALQDFATRPEAEQRRYRLQQLSEAQNRTLWQADEPSLFVPCCPCFKRTKHASYAVRYDQIMSNSMGMIHFEMPRYVSRIASVAQLVQFGSFFVTALSIAIIGSLTNFQAGQSTLISRVVFMLWLGTGIAVGSQLHIMIQELTLPTSWQPMGNAYLLHLSLLIYYVPAAVGSWQVARGMQQYGVCIWLS